MKRFVALLVLALALAGCSGQESEIDHFSACPGINSNFDFGNTPEVDGADIVQNARTGKYIIEQVSGALAAEGHEPTAITHLLRTDDTCGEHDLIVFVQDGGLCAAVLGRDFIGTECLVGQELTIPAIFDVPTGDPAYGQALAIHVPPTTRHVLAPSGGRTVAAFPVNGWALVVTFDGVDELTIVDTDGSSQKVTVP